MLMGQADCLAYIYLPCVLCTVSKCRHSYSFKLAVPICQSIPFNCTTDYFFFCPQPAIAHG